jgi:shikimate kinase
MSDARSIQNLVLVGFMGTGKSAVGRLVAQQLHFAFIDTDELIENEVGKTIPEIFAQQGEAAFRKYEQDVVKALSARRDTVIAAGGGLAADPSNLASLKTHSLVVCLWASPETILARVRTQTHRPLLQTPDPLAKIRELLAQRAPAYRQADVQILTDFRSPKDVVQHVLHQFHLAQKSR